VFTAVLRTIHACERWLQSLEPISAVFQMIGPRNTLRRLVVDGDPVVTGLLAIGDSVCTTNPTFGRGLSLAMWGAADLNDVIDQHAGNSTQQALALDQRVAEHLAPYYEEQAAVDAARLTTLRHNVFGDPAPPASRPDSDRITFAQLREAASYDATAFRAFWELMFMFSLPDDVYRNPRIVTCTTEALETQGSKDLQSRGHLGPQISSPTGQQLLGALAISTAHI
jgi:hypothetical protein